MCVIIFAGSRKWVSHAASLEAASPPGCPAGGVCAASGPRRVEGLFGCLPLSLPTAQRPEDKARSAATNRPGRPAQRGRTGRQQGPKRTPGAEEAGGRARKAAQRASERRRPQTSTREPGQKPPNSCQQAPPAKNGRDRRDGRRERAGRPQAPEEPDKGPGRTKARAGGDAHKDRTLTCARGGGPGSERAELRRPNEQRQRGPTHRRPQHSEGAGAKGARPPAESRHAASSGPRSQGGPGAPAYRPRGERPPGEQPCAARRREWPITTGRAQVARLRSVQAGHALGL